MIIKLNAYISWVCGLSLGYRRGATGVVYFIYTIKLKPKDLFKMQLFSNFIAHIMQILITIKFQLQFDRISLPSLLRNDL